MTSQLSAAIGSGRLPDGGSDPGRTDLDRHFPIHHD